MAVRGALAGSAVAVDWRPGLRGVDRSLADARTDYGCALAEVRVLALLAMRSEVRNLESEFSGESDRKKSVESSVVK